MANNRTKSIIKKTLAGLLMVFVAIQFIRPAKNIAATPLGTDIASMYAVPDSVKQILAKACYDCHSDNTRYPWYNNIQPVAWWLNDHITEGKHELNFSEFDKRTLPKQAKKLKKLAKEVQDGGMPLDSYTWIHADARLTDAEKNTLIMWANNLSQEIAAKAPATN